RLRLVGGPPRRRRLDRHAPAPPRRFRLAGVAGPGGRGPPAARRAPTPRGGGRAPPPRRPPVPGGRLGGGARSRAPAGPGGRARRMVEALFEARRLRLGSLRWGVLAVVVPNAVLFWFLAHDALSGHLGLGPLVVFAQAAAGASALAYGEVDWWFRQSAQPVPGGLDLADRVRSAGSLPAGHPPAARTPGPAIEFPAVRFADRGSARPVLDGFSLRVRAGTSLAIVGQNGAGKTTLAKLLCRLYDPERGAVLVDGVDLRELDLDGWRARMAV